MCEIERDMQWNRIYVERQLRSIKIRANRKRIAVELSATIRHESNRNI